MQFPVSGIDHASPRQQRITALLQPLALRVTVSLSHLSCRHIQPVHRAMHQEFYRQQQRHGRPPGDKDRLPRQPARPVSVRGDGLGQFGR